MKNKRVHQKPRDIETRKRKKTVIISAEGKNKTETCYFRNFNRQSKSFIIRFAKGNDTDPVKIAKAANKSIKAESINFNEGDRVFCLLDTDINQDKQHSINEAVQYAKAKHIEVILSNPCFEVWFLLHFSDSTKAFSSNDQLLKALKKYIPEYKKSSDVYSMLAAKTGNAISNAKKLEKYHIKANHRLNTMECNPSTAVYKVVSLLSNE